MSPAANWPANTQILDDKNLVVLVKSNCKSKLQPQYLLRSDAKTFRIEDRSSINNFICKP